MHSTSPHITLMQRAIDKASRHLVRDFGEVEKLQVSRKGASDFVTAADLKAERILVEELSKGRPDYGFLLEEGGTIQGKNSEYRWIIDPLDGTMNFIHSIPYFCISIGLERTVNGQAEIVAAMIDAPILKERYWSEKGQGTWVDKEGKTERLRVSARRKIEEALFMVGSFRHADESETTKIQALAAKTTGLRSMGSAALALAYVAAGKTEAFFQHNLYPWDMAGGILLVREAGGKVTDCQGGDKMFGTSSILASNNTLHSSLLKEIG